MQPQMNSMEPSGYVGTVARTREADVCFKVRRHPAGSSSALDSQLLQCNQTGHWASGDRFRTHTTNLILTVVFQIAPTLLVRVNRSARKVPRREAKPVVVTDVVRRVTGLMVRCTFRIARTPATHQPVACPNPDGGTSKPKSRSTTTRTASTSKRGAKTTRSTSGSSTRGKNTRGKKTASKFAAADEW